MSNNSSPTYVFTPSDYDSAVPKFLDGIDVNRNLRFVTKVIPLRLNTLKHSVVTIEISISDNVDYGCVSFTRPNSLWLSSSPKKDDLFIPSDDTLQNVHVIKKDGVKNSTKYYVIINVGFEFSEVSDMLFINIGLGRINDVDELTTLSVTYDCPVEIYSYETGVHVYSPYDSIYNPKLKTKLYSFTEISQWTSNTLVYSQPSFNNPALPYYYGYGDKVYKVGSLIDRTFGTTYYYRVTAKNIITWGGTFTKTSTTKLTDGPRSYYNPITDTSDVCVIPKISRVGRITEIILKTTLIKPLKYRYYLGYDATVRRNSSYDTFTVYKYNGEKHLPIVGSFDAIMKLGSGLINGWNNTETDWRKIIGFRGMAGIWTFKEGINFPALGFGIPVFGILAYGIHLPSKVANTGLRFDLRGACGCAGPGTASKAMAGKSKFLTKIFGKTAVIPGWGMIIAAAALLAMIIIAIVKFLKTKTQTFREKCKIYLHRYCSTPYIEIGSTLLDREGNVSTPGLYYCDGIYYYSQTPNGTVTSKINCTDSFYDYEEDPKEPETFSIQTSITPDNPRLVTGWDELIILPYTSGKPEPICQGTIYHSIKLEKEVPNKCCGLEIFNSTKVVIPEKQEFSCISQLDANNKAQILLDSSYEFATTNGNYTESIPEEYYGILDSEFTNSPWVETQNFNGYTSASESTTLYFDNRDKLGLTVAKTVYFDPSGCQKALKGFYTGAPYGGTLDGTPSTILSNQPIKTYQVESGKIKNIFNKSVSNTFYPTYISNWFLTDSSMATLINNAELMSDSRTFDPLSLENNIKCYQGLIKKPSETDDYLDIKEFLILSGGTYVPAPEGFYLPLIDWIRHTPFYYSKTRQIVLNISENCDTNIARGFYILGIDKKTNSNTPVFNSVILEVIVKSSNGGKTKVYSATTSPSFNKTLIPYGTFFTSSDIISEIYISRIITQSPLNNITYTIGDTYVCPSVGVAIIPCNGSFTPKTTLGLGYYEMTTDVGQTVGPVSIDFDAKQTPDRFQIYWNNKLVCDSLFVGNVLYGPSRQYHVDNIINTKILNRYILKNNEWQRYITPTINVSYSLSDIASKGLRLSEVSTPSPQLNVDKYYGTNISEGKIRLTFNKTTSLPSIIRIVTISPIGSFDWNIDKLSCYTPPFFLKFSSRADLKSDGTWKLCSNCRFGIGFNPFLHGFSLSRCGEFSLSEYTNRSAKLQINADIGGVPVKVIIFKNEVEFFSTTMTTQANSWAESALLLNADGNCLNQSDIYTFSIEYTQPIAYEARVEIVIKDKVWDTAGRYLGIYTNTTYLVGVFVKGPGPITQPCQDRQIGRQVWTSCNLNVDRYRDGAEIPNVTDMSVWSGLTTGAWCYYKNSTITGDTYGKLYNWYAMMGIHNEESKNDISKRKQIAPLGYHVPTIQEWDYLTMWVTGRWDDEFQYEASLLDSANRFAGATLKSKGHVESGDGLWRWDAWEDRTAGISDDAYRFTALPGGYRAAATDSNRTGYDASIGLYGSWWTSSTSAQYNNAPLYKNMWVYYSGAYTSSTIRQDGRSIRLIKD